MTFDRMIADAIDGIPDPGNPHALVGHAAVWESLINQFDSGKMHHGLLLSGPKGIGKATLALRFAARVLSNSDSGHGNETFHLQKIGQGAHENMMHITRTWDVQAKKFRTQITVDEVRRVKSFFNASRARQGWRVAIIDAVDELNRNSANALLKLLEEPPERSLLILISHSNAKLLPTLRSRCQRLEMSPLPDDELLEVLSELGVLEREDATGLQLANLAEGSVRTAVQLIRLDGMDLNDSIEAILKTLANPDWHAIDKITDDIVQRGSEERYALLTSLINQFLHRQATTIAHDRTTTSLARWAEVWEKAQESFRTASAYNLDRKQVLINVFQEMSGAARLGNQSIS